MTPLAKWMRKAIAAAHRNSRTGDGGPFGACIVRGNRAIAVARNTVLKEQTAVCHAEINAIRIASRQLKRFDLSDCVIYSTTEPCPMCFAAIHWARIPVIVYGTAIHDVAALGFNELALPNRLLKKIANTPVRIYSGFEKRRCQALLREWQASAHAQVY